MRRAANGEGQVDSRSTMSERIIILLATASLFKMRTRRLAQVMLSSCILLSSTVIRGWESREKMELSTPMTAILSGTEMPQSARALMPALASRSVEKIMESMSGWRCSSFFTWA